MGDDESIGFAHAMRSQQNEDYVTLLLEMRFFCFLPNLISTTLIFILLQRRLFRLIRETLIHILVDGWFRESAKLERFSILLIEILYFYVDLLLGYLLFQKRTSLVLLTDLKAPKLNA